MRRIVPLLVLLAACQPQAPDGEPAPPPAAAPVPVEAAPNDFEQDLNILGTEPFWAVHIRGSEMKLMRPDHPDLVVAKPAPVVEAGKAVWQGAGFTVSLAAQGPGSDGMSDRVYPFTAQIDVGGEVMKGCGARADAVFPPV
jgi:uncharacterized membrane protein